MFIQRLHTYFHKYLDYILSYISIGSLRFPLGML
nr:MAG TPA: hypothetical protein [Caudoviricetes sp.]DAX54724.1 MAG TPA: hypothetical protein [Caudoviricetes sp.]